MCFPLLSIRTSSQMIHDLTLNDLSIIDSRRNAQGVDAEETALFGDSSCLRSVRLELLKPGLRRPDGMPDGQRLVGASLVLCPLPPGHPRAETSPTIGAGRACPGSSASADETS